MNEFVSKNLRYEHNDKKTHQIKNRCRDNDNKLEFSDSKKKKNWLEIEQDIGGAETNELKNQLKCNLLELIHEILSSSMKKKT